MRTDFQQDNADFSTRAHLAARNLIYPDLFQTSHLEFEDTLLNMGERERILDGEMGVDRIVHVTVRKLSAPIVFTVQERFRKPHFAKYQDITVTEWNHASNLPSELYKINAGLFLYGYFNDERSIFTDAICVHVSPLLLAIARESIPFTLRWNAKRQTFLCFRFAELTDMGVVAWRLGEARKKSVARELADAA